MTKNPKKTAQETEKLQTEKLQRNLHRSLQKDEKKASDGGKLLTAFRIFFYVLVALVCYVSATAGTGVKPVLLLPLTVAVASYTNQLYAAICGILCGFLTDIAFGTLPGFNALVFIIIAVLTSLIYAGYFKRKFITFFIINAIASVTQAFVSYFFCFWLWNRDKTGVYFKDVTLKSLIETIIGSIFIYFLVWLVNKLLRPMKQKTMEQAVRYELEEKR